MKKRRPSPAVPEICELVKLSGPRVRLWPGDERSMTPTEGLAIVRETFGRAFFAAAGKLV
jgi:hypothetical protein